MREILSRFELYHCFKKHLKTFGFAIIFSGSSILLISSAKMYVNRFVAELKSLDYRFLTFLCLRAIIVAG